MQTFILSFVVWQVGVLTALGGTCLKVGSEVFESRPARMRPSSYQDLAPIETTGRKGSFEGYLREASRGSVVEVEVFDRDGEPVAAQSYLADGQGIAVFETKVYAPDLRERGISAALDARMIERNPAADSIESNLVGTNAKIYFQGLASGRRPEQAVRQTPAYRNKAAQFELDVGYSVLPVIDRPDAIITLYLKRREGAD